jgi:hypothetical protein
MLTLLQSSGLTASAAGQPSINALPIELFEVIEANHSRALDTSLLVINLARTIFRWFEGL